MADQRGHWCLEHSPAGYDCFCDEALDLANGLHRASGVGNAFGGYNCVCGEPWLDTLGGCVNGPRAPITEGDPK